MVLYISGEAEKLVMDKALSDFWCKAKGEEEKAVVRLLSRYLKCLVMQDQGKKKTADQNGQR